MYFTINLHDRRIDYNMELDHKFPDDSAIIENEKYILLASGLFMYNDG